ncbi:9513_t:CDS:2 [Paraglomus brasilianum]|uniref:9513_t:CDS:1 n=1 Tax=Paraglomus brasilianum TaxID=144538 RepID=A0A9N9CCP4_9GLOM|nr:9513_t:CDS:2 [Paraglomus brasilianum]
MGKVVWSQWANLIAIVAGVFEVVGGVFGLFYRLSMWEQVTSIFNAFVIPINVIAIVCIVFGLAILAIEVPLPLFKGSFFTRTYVPRIVLYTIFAAVSFIDYQNVNPGLYMYISCLMYTIALAKGENKVAPKETRGLKV